MRVSALNKPAGTKCVHMKDTGCSNYDNRPAACRDWYCMWLRDRKGLFSSDERPDRVGVFLTASEPDGPDGRQEVLVHPVRPDVMNEPAAAALVKRLQQLVPVRVLAYQPETVPETVAVTVEGTPTPSR